MVESERGHASHKARSAFDLLDGGRREELRHEVAVVTLVGFVVAVVGVFVVAVVVVVVVVVDIIIVFC